MRGFTLSLLSREVWLSLLLVKEFGVFSTKTYSKRLFFLCTLPLLLLSVFIFFAKGFFLLVNIVTFTFECISPGEHCHFPPISIPCWEGHDSAFLCHPFVFHCFLNSFRLSAPVSLSLLASLSLCLSQPQPLCHSFVFHSFLFPLSAYSALLLCVSLESTAERTLESTLRKLSREHSTSHSSFTVCFLIFPTSRPSQHCSHSWQQYFDRRPRIVFGPHLPWQRAWETFPGRRGPKEAVISLSVSGWRW